ncbi:MAG TPA: diadenylate cyclase [Candidatus Thermoplasmatota archaeon]|nr:diadenylate cyclase [Candidatus Thermoplasmatota archaeon]
MDRTEALLAAYDALAGSLSPSILFLVTDRRSVVEIALKHTRVPVFLATSNEPLRREFAPRLTGTLRFAREFRPGFNALTDLNDILMEAYLEGRLGSGKDVLVLASLGEAMDTVVLFDATRDPHLSTIRKELEERVDLPLLERMLRLAGELSREGREGAKVGAVFVIGDSDAVMARSKPLVLNPFEGHAEARRNLLDDAVWETAKEFSQLDGAFIVRENGVVVAAGRYIDTDKDIELPSGLGGRHLAAASITKITKAVAITVSTSGTIRVFKDGRIVITMARF